MQRSTDRGRGDITAARGNQQQGDEEEEEEEEAQLPWPGGTPVKPKPTHTVGCCGRSPGRTPKDHFCCSEERAKSPCRWHHHGIASKRKATLE